VVVSMSLVRLPRKKIEKKFNIGGCLMVDT